MERKKDLISIIVPVYNVEKYLDSCLKSVLSQTYKNIEVILIDDGSTDHSRQICEEYCVNKINWKFIHQDNAGLSSARNTGVKYATGKYITFIDSDDLVNENFIAYLYRKIVDTGADVSICSFEETEENCKDDHRAIAYNNPGLLTGREATKRLYALGSTTISVTTWGKLFLKELFNNVQFPVGRIHEDQATTYKAFYKASYIAVGDEPLYCYRNRQDSIMHTRFSNKRYDDIIALNEAERYFIQKNDAELVRLVRDKRDVLIARYSFYARTDHSYLKVPKQYRLSFIQAWNVLKEKYSENDFEHVMYQHYPRLIVLRSIIRRIFKTRTPNL